MDIGDRMYTRTHKSRHSSSSLAAAQLRARLAALPALLLPANKLEGRFAVVAQSERILCLYLFIYFFVLFPPPDKTVKLWKISERDKRPEGYNLKDEDGRFRDPSTITTLRVRGRRKLPGPSRVRSLSLFVQRRCPANVKFHTHDINSEKKKKL